MSCPLDKALSIGRSPIHIRVITRSVVRTSSAASSPGSTGQRSTLPSSFTSDQHRELPACQGQYQPGSLVLNCVLDGEAYDLTAQHGEQRTSEIDESLPARVAIGAVPRGPATEEIHHRKNTTGAFLVAAKAVAEPLSGLNFPKTDGFSRKCCSSAATRFWLLG